MGVPSRVRGIGPGSYVSPRTVEVIGEGPYSLLMLEGLLNKGVNVTHYVVKDKPDAEVSDIDIRTFSTARGLSRVIGNADYSVVFSLGLRIPDSAIDKLGGKLLNIHTSLLPEFRGVADPIKEIVAQKREYGGVSVHEVGARLDYGDILGQMRFELKPTPKLHRHTPRFVDLVYTRSAIPAGAELFTNVLKNIDKIVPVSQSDLLDVPVLSISRPKK